MEKKTNLLSKLGADFRSKSVRAGGYSTVAVALLLAMVVVVNLLVPSLPTNITKLDMSGQDLLKLSQQTKTIVSNAKEEVTLYLLAEAGTEDDTILALLKRYSDLNSKIRVVKKDPVASPGFVTSYTDATLSGNDVLVVCGERSRFISVEDIYLYDIDYNTYEYSVTFNGENALTSAIDYVTNGNLPKLYLLSGHGENSLSTSLTDAISNDNIETASLSLLTMEAVPEDATAVLINGPTSDISADELELLRTYLSKGGNVMLVTDYKATSLPNLEALMADYAMEAAHGLLVEGNSSGHMRGYAYYLLPTLSALHDISAPLKNAGYYVCTPLAHGLTVAEGYDSDTLTVNKLLTTSSSAYLKDLESIKTGTEKAEGDPTGSYATAISVEKAADSVTSRAVWISSLQALSETVDGWVSGGNTDFVINALDWLCQKEESISIRGKTINTSVLTVPSSDGNTWNIVLIFLLPASMLVTGIAVFVRRKRK